MSNVDISVIVAALENGLLDVNEPNLLRTLEDAAGRKINIYNQMDPSKISPQFLMKVLMRQNGTTPQPSIQPGQTVNVGKVPMPVVKTNLPVWMDKGLTTPRMYERATQITDDLRAKSEILRMKGLRSELYARYKEWCTPELFEYLSMKGPRAEAELRAAFYPIPVSFSHRTMKCDGRMYMIPYITFDIASQTDIDARPGDIANTDRYLSFYCNQWNQVHGINEKAESVFPGGVEKDSIAKAKDESYKAWLNTDAQLRCKFVNPKTGNTNYVILKHSGTENFLEKTKFGNDYTWCKWRDITSVIEQDGYIDFDKYWAQYPGAERDQIEEKGKEAIAFIDKMLKNIDIKGLKKLERHIGFDEIKKVLTNEYSYEYTTDEYQKHNRDWSQDIGEVELYEG